jgi:ABC-2 type transport system permease protein
MTDFFKKRAALHQKHMMRYLRYVFNDHFMLVMLILIGGIGLYYSNLIKTLPTGFVWGLPITLVLWLALLHVGRFATLVQSADMVYLLPKETAIKTGYLNKALVHSFWLPAALLLIGTGALMPLVVVSGGGAFDEFPFYFVMVLFLKLAHLFVQKINFFQDTTTKQKTTYVIWLGLSLASLALGLWVKPVVGLLAGLITCAVSFFISKEEHALLDWQKMVELEEGRLHRIYQFLNLFTDVPEIGAKVHRRKYLDGLLVFIQGKSRNPYLYLFARRLLRGSEFSGLYLRLVVIGGLFLALLDDWRFSIAIGVLFIYLIGFQLIPLYTQFRYMVLSQLYPTVASQKVTALKRLVTITLVIAAAIFTICTFIGLRDLSTTLLVLLILIVEVFAFVQVYLAQRLKKMND